MARISALVPPHAGAVVMASAIVSDALRAAGRQDLSLALLVVAGAAWLVLAAALLVRSVGTPGVFGREAHEPGALTEVAATAVLAARLATLRWWPGAAVLGVLAALAFARMAPAVVAALPARRTGGHLLLTVATESLAVVAALLAPWVGAEWLLDVALGLAALGLALYVLVASRFHAGELRTGAGDQWILAGALAITAYAVATVLTARPAFGRALQDADLALWALAVALLVVLVAGEVRWPRPAYDLRRWATVFPLGMVAQASFEVGHAAGVPAIATFGRWWTWVAFAAWLVVAVGLGGRIARVIRRLRVGGLA